MRRGFLAPSSTHKRTSSNTHQAVSFRITSALVGWDHLQSTGVRPVSHTVS